MEGRSFKIGIAQIAPHLGDVGANLKMHVETMEQAAAQGVNLLVFPELSLTGYVLRDLVQEVAIDLQDGSSPLSELADAAGRLGLDVTVGFVEEGTRKKFHIASAYISKGEVLHVHRKVYLPTYTFFDEGRYFAPGNRFEAFDTRFGRVGMLICEDFWHLSSPYLLWMDGADVLLLMSSSPGRGLHQPGRMDSIQHVELANQMFANFFTVFVAHANRVGFEDGLNFWGGSTLFGPDGQLVAHAPYFQEALLTAEIDMADIRRARVKLPLLRDEKPLVVLENLERIVRER
jgi:NAD+ synthase (glutamine-hydrolysing)